MHQSFARLIRTGFFQRQLAVASLGSLVLKGTSQIVALITAIFIARFLGAAEYGAYAYALAIIGFLAIPAGLGMGQLVVREVASYRATNEWGLLRGLIRRANLLVFTASVGATFALLIAVYLFGDDIAPDHALTYLFAALLIPFMTRLRLIASALQGLQRTVLGQLPEMLVHRVSLLALVLCMSVLSHQTLTSTSIMAVQVLAYGISTIIAWMILRHLASSFPTETRPIFQTAHWLRAAFPLLAGSGLQIAMEQSHFLVLGAMVASEDVGIYRAASQAAITIGFGLTAVNVALRPRIAHLYAIGKRKQLQRTVTRSSRLTLALAVIPLLLILLWGDVILSLFGDEFRRGSSVLLILCFGHLANVVMGPVIMLLNMTNNAVDTIRGLSIGVVLNLVLSLLLIPQFGMNGAAIAYAVSVVAWNVVLYVLVNRRLGLQPTAFGRL